MTPQPIEGVMAERTAEEIIVAELSGLLHSPHGASPTAQAILAALADAGLHLCGGLLPAEKMVLTVAKAQASRGDSVPPNTAMMLIMAIERLTGLGVVPPIEG